MCLLFCFVLFWILCCVVCKKNENKKLLITKNSLKIYEDLNFEPVNRSSQFFRVVTAISMRH